MKYRAKCTKIVSFIEDNYNCNVYHIVRDAKDKYIEVDTLEEADIIEELNRLQEKAIKLKLRLYDILDDK